MGNTHHRIYCLKGFCQMHSGALISALAMLLTTTGCLNLSKDVVLPVKMLENTIGVTKLEDFRVEPSRTREEIAHPAAIIIENLNVERAEGALPESVVVNHYSGLELLNRAAGNGRDNELSLARAADAQITEFRRTLYDPSAGKTRSITFRYRDFSAPLSKDFIKDPSVKRLLEATREEVHRTGKRNKSLNILKARKLASNIARSINTIYDDPVRQEAMLESLHSMQMAAEKPNKKIIDIRLDAILFAYMQSYLEGTFVDRGGTTISKPDISAKLGNDTITSFEKILLEAVYDYAMLTPIMHDKSDKSHEKEVTPTSEHEGLAGAGSGKDSKAPSKPTFVVLFPDLYEEVSVEPDARGITSAELKFMTFLRGMGSEQSKHLASLITRFIGGFAFVGKLSVGDNDTLAKVVATLCEEFTADTTEAISYDFFQKFQYKVTEDPTSKSKIFTANKEFNEKNLGISESVGNAIAKALQYEDLLETLIKREVSK